GGLWAVNQQEIVEARQAAPEPSTCAMALLGFVSLGLVAGTVSLRRAKGYGHSKTTASEPMTFGNMRHLGVQRLIAYCLSIRRADMRGWWWTCQSSRTTSKCRRLLARSCASMRRGWPSHRRPAELEGAADTRKLDGEGVVPHAESITTGTVSRYRTTNSESARNL